MTDAAPGKSGMEAGMKYQNILIPLVVTALAIPLLKSLYDWAQAPGPTTKLGNSPKVPKMVERTLHEHEGEASPFVQAFEEALEEEAHHDKSPAHSAGLHT